MNRSRTLTSIKALIGFESAARLLSFTQAARELNVTQTAISHQIKSLEQQLEVKLFHRQGKNLTLTRAGKKLLPVASDSFSKLESVIRQIKQDTRTNLIRISVTPSFATQWLVPRLGKFWDSNPGVELNLHHSLELVDFSTDEVDMAVRAGDGEWQGLTAEFLFSLDLSPVCHPALLEGEHPIRQPSDLAHHTLLHDHSYQDWEVWLKAAGIKNIDPRAGNIMNDSNSLKIAAINRQGVALGKISLLRDDIAAGNLVLPFDIHIKSTFAYYLVYPLDKLNNQHVRRFRNFILNQSSLQASR